MLLRHPHRLCGRHLGPDPIAEQLPRHADRLVGPGEREQLVVALRERETLAVACRRLLELALHHQRPRQPERARHARIVAAVDEDVVAVLTGNLMKDPSYSIDYHTGTLRLDEGGGSQVIEARFANRPVRAPADKDMIKKVLGV